MKIKEIAHVERSHRFGKHDRLTIDGATYRSVGKKGDKHRLQLIVGGVVQDHFAVKTDAEINDLIRRRRFAVAANHYSRAATLLRTEFDDTDTSDIDEEDLRTIAWKKEWCVRFNLARTDIHAETRPGMSLEDMAVFIEANKHAIEKWYIRTFNSRRPLGRKQRDGVAKEFDYPSPGALKNWLEKWKRHACKASAFILHYDNCGNRHQLRRDVEETVDRSVKNYAGSREPAKADIYEDILAEFNKLNRDRPEGDKLSIGQTAVLRRINKLEPFKVKAGRKGVDRAIREFTPVGYGLDITVLLSRVEMDDWDMDLHVLVEKSVIWKSLTKKQRDLVPRVRCTATVAIDVASRAIVGFNLTKDAPSAIGSKSALRSILVDKDEFAKWAGAASPWPMHGRPFELATDGGPAFKGDFAFAVMRCRLNHVLPEQDPRMRGTIESFFRTFRRLCRYFAGQAFSNVVEKGDYDGEQMASLTVDELYRLAVRFIVDLYHHRRHRGLERRTPFAVWTERQKTQGLEGFFSEEQIINGFGIRTKATIDKHGVLYMGNSYQGAVRSDPGARNLVAVLHRILPKAEVDIVIDPFDLGTILIRVPDSYRGHAELGGGDFVLADCLNAAVQGRTLEALLAADARVRELARKEEAAGRPFRLGAHRDLRDAGELARVRAGHPEFTFTQDEYDRAVAVMERKGAAGIKGVDYGVDPVNGDGPLGTLVATARRTRSSKPGGGASTASDGAGSSFSGSINNFGKDRGK